MRDMLLLKHFLSWMLSIPSRFSDNNFLKDCFLAPSDSSLCLQQAVKEVRTTDNGEVKAVYDKNWEDGSFVESKDISWRT